jgi:hypothetical protein
VDTETKEEHRTVEGSCLCGLVQFDVTTPSKFCCHCHCSNCRRAHGAAFVTWVGFRAGQVRILSGGNILIRYQTDTGATRSFCGCCGTTLFYEGPRWVGDIHVVLGNINGEIDRLPAAHVYVDHKAPWWTIRDSLPQYGGKTGNELKKEEEEA